MSKISKKLSNGSEEFSEIKYAVDFNGSGEQLMKMNNMVSITIETKKTLNNKIIDYSKTDYASFGDFSKVYPSKIYSMDKLSNVFKLVDFLDYDTYGTPRELLIKNGPTVTYLWGYNGQYPIAKIENASYSEVLTALGGGSIAQGIINSLNAGNVSGDTINTYVGMLRMNLGKAKVSTYTYKPLVGMISMTDPRGVTENYTYDGFQRLKEVLDFDKNIVKDYKYNYRP